MLDIKFFHDSQNSFYRSPSSAVPCSQDISLRFKICDPGVKVDRVVLRLWGDGCVKEINDMDMQEGISGERIYQAEVNAPSSPCLLWYFFIIYSSEKIYYYGNNPERLGGVGRIYESQPDSYQITVYKEGYNTPSWFKDSIMYQIMVDRFYNGNDDEEVKNYREDFFIHGSWDDTPCYKFSGCNDPGLDKDFFGGNLRGIIKKLPYLKELGVSVIYLNPIFEAASNHKYNTGDYMKVDPMFGDEAILKELIGYAKDMGIFIILDGVFSHTGSDSLYFNREGNYPGIGAYQSVESPYYSWYNFRHYPDDYACWWGVKTLPEVNELEPSYREFIAGGGDSVINHWMNLGIKGWRLDVADELPDEFIMDIRETIKTHDDESVLIGEVWEDASNKVSYGKLKQYFLGNELDSVMNYRLRDGLIGFLTGKCSGEYLNRVINSIYENYPMHSFYSLMNILGTHDTPRIKYVLSGVELGQDISFREKEASISLTQEQQYTAMKRLHMATAFLTAFPGVPCIYYGDEAGLGGGHDPLNRCTYPWGSEDKSLIEWYRSICGIRKSIDALRTGLYKAVHYSTDTFGFVRVIEGSTDVFGQKRDDGFVLVLLNNSIDNCHDIIVDLREWNVFRLYGILDKEYEITSKDGCFSISIPSLKCLILGGLNCMQINQKNKCPFTKGHINGKS